MTTIVRIARSCRSKMSRRFSREYWNEFDRPSFALSARVPERDRSKRERRLLNLLNRNYDNVRPLRSVESTGD